jgi:hypothetical protein
MNWMVFKVLKLIDAQTDLSIDFRQTRLLT